MHLLPMMALLPLFVAPPGDTPRPKPVPLWDQNVPLAKGDTDAEKPDITVYLPDPQKATGTAVVICPGGGYSTLMTSYEGDDVARWLNTHGVAGVVLKYRVNRRHPAPLLDAQRAMRTVRAHAKEWRLDPNRIGVMGFSAGGHVASTVGTHFDVGNPHASDPIERVGCRPDFLILVYPVITMGPKTHAGSRDILLGKENRSAAEEELLSNEKQVTDQTPPTFLVHAKTDSVVPVENSAMFYAALQAHHVPAEFLELPEGEHGLGVGSGPLWKQWQAACLDWMAKRGLLRPTEQ
jgi:acetyl esterase/lipase